MDERKKGAGMTPSETTKYQEIPLATVMKYFADGFTPCNGEKFVGMEWFIDTIKQKAIFRIDVDQPEEEIK